MNDSINELLNIIEQSQLSDKHSSRAKELLTSIKKQKMIDDFKIQRTLKDKTIYTRMSKEMIEELQDKNKMVERQSLELKANYINLEHAYKELEQFSYIVSHDLKSPLRTIGSFAQLINGETDLNATSQEYMKYVLTSVHYMENIIDDLLQYSKVGSKETKPVSLELNQLMEDIQLILRHSIKKQNAIIDILNPLPKLVAKKSAIQQLFQNLISNAIKFRSENTPHIKISSKKTINGMWEFELSDNGLGMSEKFQKKAFLPFQRLTDSKTPGTGIGLAICKKVVQMHGGNIHYKSSSGKGTTFFFTLKSLEVAA